MGDWQKQLNYNPLPILQSIKNKSINYFVRKDLLGEEIDSVESLWAVREAKSIIPRKNSSSKLNKLFLESAKELNIKIKDIYALSGVWSDYMPIVQEGFEACWLGSEPGLKFVHTVKDDMNLVFKEGIRNILLLCMTVITKLENEFS